MKRRILKNISLFILTILIGILMLNDNEIKIFASNLSFSSLQASLVVKSGDYIAFDEYCTRPEGCSLDTYFRIYNPETDEFTEYQKITYEYDTDKYWAKENYIIAPQYNGKDVEWIVDYKEFKGSVGINVLKLYYADYKNPKFDITCDKDVLREGESSECAISLDIMSYLENATCELTSDKVIISDVKLEDKWTTTITDNIISLKYATTPKFEITMIGYYSTTSITPDKSRILDVGTFKVTSTEKITDSSINDIIRLSNCEFKDNYKEDNADDVEVPISLTSNIPITTTTMPTTIMTTSTKEEEKAENPKTGVENYVLLGIIIILCGLCVLYFVKDNIFKKI